MSDFLHFVSFPNYKPTLHTHNISIRNYYTCLEDVIRILYELRYDDKHIREVYAAFHESGYLNDTLLNVRACIIQLKPNKICLLENTTATVRSERVMFIRMYEFTGGAQQRCNTIQNAIVYIVLGLFAIVGLNISLSKLFEMFISS